MRKKLRIAAVLSASLLLLLAVSMLTVYYAAQQVPQFYREAISRRPTAQRRASDQMLQQATALASDVRKAGRWQAIFTADQINGWLAVDLVKNHPHLLPPEVRDPRVEIRDRQATIACRYEGAGSPMVYSLTFDVYLSDVDTIALHVHRARAGKLPIPLGQVLDGISEAARNLELPLAWRQKGGDPVALIKIDSARDDRNRNLQLDKIELRQGELWVAGKTVPHSAVPAAPDAKTGSPLARRPDSIGAPTGQVDSGTNENVQR